MAEFLTNVSTRETYGKALVELGRENPDVVVLGGDLNKSTFVHLFAQEFPDRFFDFGPAEQNIMSVAAGMAASGKIPFVSTFAVFGMCRPFDQVRVSIAQPHLGVKIVCTHAGILTGEDGMSAHGIEDLSLACSLPGFNVVAPADAVETVHAVRVAAETPGPFYIRLYRPATPVVHENGCNFSLGKGEVMRQGSDVSIIATGVMVATALQAADSMAKQGIKCRVINIHTLSPLDEGIIATAATETGAVVTVEEHLSHGGLSSLVAQALGHTVPSPMETVALKGYTESGDPELLARKYHLSLEDVEAAVKRVLERKAA